MNKKKIFLGLLILMVSIQFFKIDKTNPSSDSTIDMFAVETVPDNVQTLLKASCFDCHSNTTVYPWYTNVAPVSWLIKSDVNEGREELNFNEWGTYSLKRKNKKLKEIEEEIEEKDMPVLVYTWMHSKARLNKQQRNEIIDWVKKLRTSK